MNNITKASGINSDYKDRMGSTNWDCLLFAKVVFLDLTNPNSKPRLYQLKDSALSDTPPDLLKSSAFTFNHDAFVFLGDVREIDKNKKKVELTNNNFVSYTHLVAVSGTKIETSFHDPEFSAGLQILVDALKLMPMVPNPFKSSQKVKKPSKSTLKTPKEKTCPQIEKLVHPYIINAGDQAIASSLSSLNKRLYSVQV